MRLLMQNRAINCATHGRLGFPVWLPLLLGVGLFWIGHLLAAEKNHSRPDINQGISHPVRLVSV
jgi:hypothetical protein